MWVPVILIVLYTGWILWQRNPFPWRTAKAYVAPDPMAAYGTRG